jgi:hypothetical protein
MKTATREIAFASGCAAVGVGVSYVLSEMYQLKDDQTLAVVAIPPLVFYTYRLAAWARRMAKG